jgi:hypothetical protein
MKIETQKEYKLLWNKIIVQANVKQTKGIGGFVYLFILLWGPSSMKLPWRFPYAH